MDPCLTWNIPLPKRDKIKGFKFPGRVVYLVVNTAYVASWGELTPAVIMHPSLEPNVISVIGTCSCMTSLPRGLLPQLPPCHATKKKTVNSTALDLICLWKKILLPWDRRGRGAGVGRSSWAEVNPVVAFSFSLSFSLPALSWACSWNAVQMKTACSN